MRDGLPPNNITVLAVGMEGGLAVAAVAIGWLIGHSPMETITWERSALITGVVATLPMLAALALLETFPLGPFRRLKSQVDNQIVPMFDGMGWAELALISMLAGLGEELLFRGLIQDAITLSAGDPWGPWFGIVVASVAFGIAHCISRTYVVVATVISVYLGLVFLVTKSLTPVIVAHGLYDFLALLYLTRKRRLSVGSKSNGCTDNVD